MDTSHYFLAPGDAPATGSAAGGSSAERVPERTAAAGQALFAEFSQAALRPKQTTASSPSLLPHPHYDARISPAAKNRASPPPAATTAVRETRGPPQQPRFRESQRQRIVDQKSSVPGVDRPPAAATESEDVALSPTRQSRPVAPTAERSPPAPSHTPKSTSIEAPPSVLSSTSASTSAPALCPSRGIETKAALVEEDASHRRPSGPDYAPKKSAFGEFMTDAEIKAQQLVDNYQRRQAQIAAARLAKQVEKKARDREREISRLKGRRANRNRLMRPRGDSADESSAAGSYRRNSSTTRSSAGSSGVTAAESHSAYEDASGSGRSRRGSNSGTISNASYARNNSKPNPTAPRQRSSIDSKQRNRRRGQNEEAEPNAAEAAEDSSFPSLDDIFLTQLHSDDDVEASAGTTTKAKASVYKPALFSKTKPKGRYPVTKRLLRMNLSQASDNYPVIPRVCKLMGWKRAKENSGGDAALGDWAIAWRDTGAVSVTTVRELIAGKSLNRC